MNNIPKNIEKLGFDKWFLNTVDPDGLENIEIARVVAVHKDSYTINNGEFDALAELLGKIIYAASSPIDFPAVVIGFLLIFMMKIRFQ